MNHCRETDYPHWAFGPSLTIITNQNLYTASCRDGMRWNTWKSTDEYYVVDGQKTRLTKAIFGSSSPHFSRKRPRRVLSKKALSLNIVIKHCLKFCWSDGCLERLSSKTAQSSAEVMAVFKDCHQRLPKGSAEVMAVFKDCHQRLPKVLLKWWLSWKIVIKDCPKFCWSDGCL